MLFFWYCSLHFDQFYDKTKVTRDKLVCSERLCLISNHKEKGLLLCLTHHGTCGRREAEQPADRGVGRFELHLDGEPRVRGAAVPLPQAGDPRDAPWGVQGQLGGLSQGDLHPLEEHARQRTPEEGTLHVGCFSFRVWGSAVSHRWTRVRLFALHDNELSTNKNPRQSIFVRNEFFSLRDVWRNDSEFLRCPTGYDSVNLKWGKLRLGP